MEQLLALGQNRIAAAVAAVAADAAVHVLLFRPDQGKFPGFRIHAVDKGILVQAMALAGGTECQNGLINPLHVTQEDRHLFLDAFGLSGAAVQPPEAVMPGGLGGVVLPGKVSGIAHQHQRANVQIKGGAR